MVYRVAKIEDIKEIKIVRSSVSENVLSNPERISNKEIETFILERGKGWVCEIDGKIVGFSIIDLKDNNVWALFLLPEFEGKGIGQKLHNLMLDWYFNQTKKNIWLGTSPNTRAEQFYRKSGWIEIGVHEKDEIKFEMTFKKWKRSNN